MIEQRVFVVEITPVIDGAGTTQTFLFCGEAWATGPTDVPAETAVQPYLKNAGTLKRELFSGARVTGAIKPGFGNIVLANPAPVEDEEGPFDSWLAYGLSGAKVTVRWGVIGDAYPSQWTDVYVAYVQAAYIDFSQVTLRLRDRLQLLDAPMVTATFDGSGGLEGSGSVPKPKQAVIRDAGFLPPILVDVVKQIYFVQSSGDGGMRAAGGGLWDVFEGGVPITRSTDYASSAELLSTAPASGECRFWFGTDSVWMAGWKNGPVYLRLGTPPVGDIRVYPSGFPNDDDFARWGEPHGSFDLATLALRAGVDRDSVLTSNVAIRMALVDDDRPFLDVMSGACLQSQGWFGFDRLDRFRDGYLCDPEDDGVYYGIDWAGAGMGAAPTAQPTTSLMTFTRDNAKDLRREPVNGMESPVWKVSVNARQTWACPVNSGATDEMRDYLTRDPWWATFQGVSDTCLVAHPGAIAETVEIPYADFPNVFSRRLHLERYFVLFGGRRDVFTFTAPMTDETLALELHDVVTLQFPRLGLSAGKKYRIVSITLDCSTAVPSIRFGVWGGAVGDYTGTVSMVPPGYGGGATPVSFTQLNRQRIGAWTQRAWGTVLGVGGGYAAYGRQQIGAWTQTSAVEVDDSGGPAETPVEWHDTDLGPDMSLSNANRTVTLDAESASNAGISIPWDLQSGGGLWYWEIHIGGTPDTGEDHSPSIGVARPSVRSGGSTWTHLCGNDAESWGYLRSGDKRTNSTSSAFGASFTAGDVIGVAFDAPNGKIWFAKNNTWQDSGDPAAGTDEAFSDGAMIDAMPIVSADMGAPTMTIQGMPTHCTYTAPSGFDYLGNATL